MIRQRKKLTPEDPPSQSSSSNSSGMPAGSGGSGSGGLTTGPPSAWSARAQWMFFALASGACAAFNGVFAKLTTTKLTSSLSSTIAEALGLSWSGNLVEVAVRGLFFALNIAFNGVMWALYTQALARGTSTTQVSVMNTSANFVVTALAGLAVFSESLPPVWWAGAALLVAGNVIIGRKDETKDEGGTAPTEAGYEPVPQQQEESVVEEEEEEEEDVADLGDLEGGRTR
ncbi:hypothetical protein N3K66_003398 [Trichothecium roseum]|uniref:Uncharacterized protein n=1 Tax=Trichothecium roseum TaxID=47278 RepID=A0ACC0V6M7_9HYPO|nr:hypothetical protein N3K66_003398 [Trichothecium roseum]